MNQTSKGLSTIFLYQIPNNTSVKQVWDPFKKLGKTSGHYTSKEKGTKETTDWES